MTWRALYTPGAQRYLSTVVLPILLEQGSWEGGLIGQRKDGTPVDVFVSLTLVHGGYLVCCCRDISARVAQERELRRMVQALDSANAALMEASRTKDAFLASMSHELRTPLHSMMGIADALSEGILGEVSVAQQKYLKQLLSSGRYLQSLIDNLLDVARLSSG